MDESVFIIAVLVIILGLLGGIYYLIQRLEQCVLGLASAARGREYNSLTNHQRLADGLNELTDELAVLTEGLKTERILHTHAETKARVGAKKAQDDRKTVEAPPPPDALARTTEPDEEIAFGEAG